MKLKRFLANRVHGYKDFNLTFNDSVTFLTGPNGSGKSTALRLIEAMITPSIRDLVMIDFQTASLELEISNTTKRIEIKKSRDVISIMLDWIDEPLVLPEISESRREFLKRESRGAEDFFSTLAFDLSSNPVFKEITEISAPLFLGVDRQHRSRYTTDSSIHDDPVLLASIKSQATTRRIIHGDSTARLLDTQVLVREAYRAARTRSDREQDQLRSKLLLSIFDYSELTVGEGDPFFLAKDEELARLNESSSHIASALGKLGVDEEDLRTQHNQFSKRLNELFIRLRQRSEDGTKGEENNYSILEYLLNRAHLVRMSKMMEVIKGYDDRSRRAFRRIHQFEAALSWFFADSNKKVQIDEVGRIAVERPDGRIATLDELSSGERQIVILFAHVFFNTFGTRSKVFVIDEPELSLHIRWQEHLVEKIQDHSPETQLIFATHSPDIVSERYELCVEV